MAPFILYAFPPLPQLCGRVLLAESKFSHRDADLIPQHLRDYLGKAGRCTVCGDPFFETLFTCTYFIEARSVGRRSCGDRAALDAQPADSSLRLWPLLPPLRSLP